MDSLLLDTNIILDADSANILEYINCAKFSVSKVVLADEVVKQIKDFNSKFREINETYDELIWASDETKSNKTISFYDALNTIVARNRKMILVTGDQKLIKFAKQYNVECFGTIRLLELLIEENLIAPEIVIQALEILINDKTRRIPKKLVEACINKIKTYLCKV